MKKLSKSAKMLSLIFGAVIIAAVSLWIYDEECLKPIAAQTFRIPVWRLIDIYIGRPLMWLSIGGLLGCLLTTSRINPKIGRLFLLAGIIIFSLFLLLSYLFIASISANRVIANALNTIAKYPLGCLPIGLLIGIGSANCKNK